MLSKEGLLRFVVGLVVVNDGDLIDDDSLLPPDVCAASDRDVVRRIRDLIQTLYRDFDYLTSPEFARLADGKSDAYCSMLRKTWTRPEKQSRKTNEYVDSLGAVLADDCAYQLTRRTDHGLLDELRNALTSLTNPNGQDTAHG